VSVDGTPTVISNRLLQLFVQVAREELGAADLALVLAPAKLEPDALEKEALARLDGAQAAGLYACLQQALRTFYGRGARGLLLRIGRKLWDRLVLQATFREKAELEVTRRLPVPARRRRALAFVADRLQEGGGSASVHLLDMDLLLADQASATSLHQSSAHGLCFVTCGLIQGALFWATGQEADVEEIACKAAGAPACEFKVTFGVG
jgi:predicted hydrocarbon binding protein